MIRRPPRSTRVRSSAASDVYKRQPSVGFRSWRYKQPELRSSDFDVRSAGFMEDLKPQSGAPHVVRLTGHHLASRLALSVPKPILLPLDPGQSLDDREPYRFFRQPVWRSHADYAEGWIDTYMQVLDVLVDDIHADSGDL